MITCLSLIISGLLIVGLFNLPIPDAPVKIAKMEVMLEATSEMKQRRVTTIHYLNGGGKIILGKWTDIK